MEEDLRSFERREWPSSLCGNSPRTWCERIDVVVVIIVVSSSGVVGWVAISTSSVSVDWICHKRGSTPTYLFVLAFPGARRDQCVGNALDQVCDAHAGLRTHWKYRNRCGGGRGRDGT